MIKKQQITVVCEQEWSVNVTSLHHSLLAKSTDKNSLSLTYQKMSPVATGPVLIKTEIPSFCLHQGSSTPNNLLRMNEIDPLSHFKGLQMGIFGF